MGKCCAFKASWYQKRKSKVKKLDKPSNLVLALEAEDLKKYKNYALERVDCITGTTYKFKNQENFRSVLGTRGVGMYSTRRIPKGKIAIISTMPGRKVNKLVRRHYLKKGYWFKGLLMYSKFEACMKANVRASNGVNSVEKPNVSLKVMSDVVLKAKGFEVKEKGMYCVLETIEEVCPNTFLILPDYGNKARFPYGYDDYIAVEQLAIRKYEDSKSCCGLPYEFTCPKCCENINSHSKKLHNLQCKKSQTFFKRKLREHGFFSECEMYDVEEDINPKLLEMAIIEDDPKDFLDNLA